ncbi:hypothetical protein [Melghirimyces algeriensis]|uniref:Uncharacterized protein n=1 Tax=Melghirimyces algeriensis TaxID=910412 RepID=A0A521F8L0_9BACL|nr:hypothetical protein [Melghirimyces algeriensis]SMO91941.1 hypothetical protein SAMN06264849_1144 [Melghirimyces algeriensis]
MRFNPTEDYKAQFETIVNEIINECIEDRTDRMRAIQALADEYVLSIGERPDPIQLERLTNYILREEITSQLSNKTSTEYPFLSERQLMTRRNGERSIKCAEEYGSDGRNYKTPKRRKWNTYESIVIDRNAKIRNKERRKKYRKATKPGLVETYNLHEE